MKRIQKLLLILASLILILILKDIFIVYAKASFISILITVIILLLYAFIVTKFKSELKTKWIWIFSAGYFVIALILGAYMRFTPIFDINAVYSGAINWSNGNGLICNNVTGVDMSTYFYYFPNNLGATFVLTIWYKILSVFTQDYLFLGILFCAIGTSVSMAATAIVSKMLFNDKAALGSIFLYLVTLPLLFSAHMFYTDFMSMPFAITSLMLFLYAKRQNNRKLSILLLICSSTAFAIGILIKSTVAIVLIAILIVLLISKEYKLLLKYSIISLVAVFSLFAILNLLVYSTQLDKEKTRQYSTPLTHWIMMGMNQNSMGGYDGYDYDYTRSFTELEERKEAIKKTIKERLNELGFTGIYNIYSYKIGNIYSEGTASVGDFVSPEDENKLSSVIHNNIYQFVNMSGMNYNLYKDISDGSRYAVLLLSLICSILLLKNKKISSLQIIPFLSIIGITLFLAVWENNDRYITNMIPILIVSASGAFVNIKKSSFSLIGKYNE